MKSIEVSNDGETWATLDPMASSEGYRYVRTRHEDGMVSYGWPHQAADWPVTWRELAELVEASRTDPEQPMAALGEMFGAGSGWRFDRLVKLLREKAEGKRSSTSCG